MNSRILQIAWIMLFVTVYASNPETCAELTDCGDCISETSTQDGECFWCETNLFPLYGRCQAEEDSCQGTSSRTSEGCDRSAMENGGARLPIALFVSSLLSIACSILI